MTTAYAGEESIVRSQVEEARTGIHVEIVEHFNPFEDRTELYVTLFHTLGFSFGMRALSIAHAERLLAKMRRDPLNWLAKLMGNPVEGERTELLS